MEPNFEPTIIPSPLPAFLFLFDEDLRGRNVLLLTSFLLRELLRYLRETIDYMPIIFRDAEEDRQRTQG